MAGVPQGSVTNFPEGFAAGINVRGIPLLQAQPGKVFYLNNSVVLGYQAKPGSNGNRGTFLDPLATLDYAVNTACMQGRGDIVLIGSGHAENISNATTAALANNGVAIVGLGAGSRRPRFIFDTATTANIPVRAANMSIQNCVFINNFADIASNFTGQSASVTAAVAAGTNPTNANPGTGSVMTVTVVGSGTLYPGATVMGTGIPAGQFIISQLTGTTGGVGTYQLNGSFTFASGTITTGYQDFAIDNCEFRDNSSILNCLTPFTSSSADQSSAGFSMTRCKVFGLGTTAATAIHTNASAADRLVFQSNYLANQVAANSGLILQSTTTKVLTNLLIDSNECQFVGTNAATGALMITTATTHTGIVSNNFVSGARALASAVLVTASSGLNFYENYYHVTADLSGALLPAIQT